MKKIFSENQLYVRLAREGDPSAFYALFNDHIRSLYIKLRADGQDHQAACAGAEEVVSRMYLKYIKRRPIAAQRWFAAGCGLRKFNPEAADAGVSRAEIADYGRRMGAALHRAYSGRLDRGSDDQGNLKSERPLLPYVAGTLAAVCLAVFLFFSEAVVSVSFGRFGGGYSISFPRMAEGLWNISGLVRTGDYTGGAVPARGVGADPAGGHE